MELEKKKKYYTEFTLPDWFKAPHSLTQILKNSWSSTYTCFFLENVLPDSIDVEEVWTEILHMFGDPKNDPIAHKRYLYMGYAMALAAKQILEEVQPDLHRPQNTIEKLKLWIDDKEKFSEDFIDQLFPEFNDPFHLGPDQTTNEANSTMYCSLKAFDPSFAFKAIDSVLSATLTGDAICFYPDQRDLFNWWLIDGVPSAYSLRLPMAYDENRWPYAERRFNTKTQKE